MYVNVNFEGVTADILKQAVERGYAKTKAEALRMAVLALNNQYDLLTKEDQEDLRDAERIWREIQRGKQKEIGKKAFEAKFGVKI